MTDTQQFCLRWHNHQSTLVSVFEHLFETQCFVDVTLAAEGKCLQAHKVVLSACSPYFQEILSHHTDKYPVIFLKDVTFFELKTLIDYMYKGEVNVSEDQLQTLMKTADSLKIKGLAANTNHLETPTKNVTKSKETTVGSTTKVNKRKRGSTTANTNNTSTPKVTTTTTNNNDANANNTTTNNHTEDEEQSRDDMDDDINVDELIKTEVSMDNSDSDAPLEITSDFDDGPPRKKNDLMNDSCSDPMMSASQLNDSTTTDYLQNDSMINSFMMPERPQHVCNSCGRTYLRKSSLSNHLRWECGKEPQFQCPYCEQKSKQKMHIIRHVNRRHKDQHYLENRPLFLSPDVPLKNEYPPSYN